jgi:hypothetical protein
MRLFNQIKIKVNVPRIYKVDTNNGRWYYNAYEPGSPPYPSVTSVLSRQEKQGITEWRERVGDVEANKISRIATNRGNVVHAAMENYVQNLPIGPVMPDAKRIIKQLQEISDWHIDNVRCVEQQLWSNHLKVAGTVDLVANYDHKISIIDWKNSTKPKDREWIKDYFIQKSAYAVMFEECTGIPVQQLVTIIGVLEGEPQVFLNDRDQWIGSFLDLRKAFDLAPPGASCTTP